MEREIYENMRQVELDHWWFKARREIIADQVSLLGLRDEANILEVGCGTGGNLMMLARFGTIVGLEPDEDSRQYAADHTGQMVLSGTLPSGLPEFGVKFDLIAALDVLEHVDADAASVSSLVELLRPGGLMVTTVPAHPWMWSHHDVVHHHKRRYDRSAYLSLFERPDLKIRKASYFNCLLFPAIASVRALQRVSGRVGSGDDSMPPAPVNRLLTKLFASEKTLLRHFNLPMGVSILLIAERRV